MILRHRPLGQIQERIRAVKFNLFILMFSFTRDVESVVASDIAFQVILQIKYLYEYIFNIRRKLHSLQGPGRRLNVTTQLMSPNDVGQHFFFFLTSPRLLEHDQYSLAVGSITPSTRLHFFMLISSLTACVMMWGPTPRNQV